MQNLVFTLEDNLEDAGFLSMIKRTHKKKIERVLQETLDWMDD